MMQNVEKEYIIIIMEINMMDFLMREKEMEKTIYEYDNKANEDMSNKKIKIKCHEKENEDFLEHFSLEMKVEYAIINQEEKEKEEKEEKEEKAKKETKISKIYPKKRVKS